VPEGHSWGSWRARLAEAWTHFWGDARTAATGAPRPLEAPPEGAARFTGTPVSLDVKDADLVEVVRTLTAGRGLSVVAPPDLKGTVTATLRDVPWDQALDLALAGNGWAFVREGRVIRIVRRGDPDR
jgi:type II secretory pathway component HofQ